MLVLAAGATLLAGCQTDTAGGGNAPVTATAGATLIAAPAPVAFQCPAAATRVTYNDGAITSYIGIDPADASVCRRTTSAGQQQRLMYNFWSLPLIGEPAVRSGTSAVWPMAPGGRTSFVFIGRSFDGNTFQYQETWRVERAERITVAGAPRDTLVVRRTQEGRLNNTSLVHETYWYDLASRTWIKREVETVRGQSIARPFEATRIEVP